MNQEPANDRCVIVRYTRIAFAIIALLLVASILASFFSTSRVQEFGSNLRLVDDMFQLQTLDFQLNVVQVQQWLTDISATRGQDGLNDGFSEAEKHARRVLELLDEMAQLHPDLGAELDRMRGTFQRYYETGKKMAQLYIDQGPAGGNPFMGNFDKAAAALQAEMEVLLQQATYMKNNAVQELNRQASVSFQVILGFSLLLGVIIFAAMLFLTRLIRPLLKLRGLTLQLKDNDYSGSPIDGADSNNEIGSLISAFNSMHSNIRDSIGRLSSSIQTLSKASSDIRNIAETSKEVTTRQQGEVSEISQSVASMADTVQRISSNTRSNAESAGLARNEVENGGKVIHSTTDSINNLAHEVVKGVEAINQVEEESRNIGSVLDVIRGIAEQTNLLALNAAIEAARAGDQGRGFAVVADEVRTLASRTQNSTQEIQDMIERLQSGSRSAVNIMERGKEQAELTVAQAERAASSLDSIRQAVDSISEKSSQIAAAAEEAQRGVDSIVNRNLQGIESAVQSTVATVNETLDAVDIMEQEAAQLRGIAKQFKL